MKGGEVAMILLTTLNDQTIQAGQPIVFDNVVMNTGHECHKCSSALTRLLRRGRYLISFSGNIGATAADGEVQLTIRDSGDNIPGTTMRMISVAGGDLQNVSNTTAINNCCGSCGTITVVNSGTTALNVGAGASLLIIEL